MRALCLLASFALFLPLAVQPLASQTAATSHPRDREIHDADTRAWWHTTEALSGDSMEGRDTGSPAYRRAAEYVARRFAEAGLKPAGEQGTWFQDVPMHEVAVDPAGTRFEVERPGGPRLSLRFLEEITVAPTMFGPTALDAPMVFRGFCGKEQMAEIAGKVVVCFGTQRAGLPSGADRFGYARAGRAAGLINVDDPFFTIEPPRWPSAYARTVGTEPLPDRMERDPSVPEGQTYNGPISMRLSAAAFPALLEGSGQDAAALLSAGGHKQPLPSFDLVGTLHVRLAVSSSYPPARKTYSSPNVLAVREGSDPVLKHEYVVVAAHLDGYGYGTAVGGDALYNGTLDDAAYVALLIQFADDLKAGKVQTKRSILFCAFTGEEKGLLGSNWYVAHPTVPLAETVADINLDQLRPLFPLHILTALAVDDSTLGTAARQVGAGMGIALRPDAEPERGLLRRADHYPFLRAGVPAIGFIFGYDPGTDAERRYREWYQVRYHRPQDDLTQPVDFEAAAKFDRFFYTLARTVADAPVRPRFVPGSSFAPKAK